MTDHFADAFLRKNIAHVYMTLWQHNDVQKLMLMPFCFEKSSVRKAIFNVLAMSSVLSMLKSGKIHKNNDHTCLFHCINTCRFPRTMFEHSAYRLGVQTASSGPGKCMKKRVIPILYTWLGTWCTIPGGGKLTGAIRMAIISSPGMAWNLVDKHFVPFFIFSGVFAY